MLVNYVKNRFLEPKQSTDSDNIPTAQAQQIVPGLMLSGGGARNAYQVGVLKAIAEHLPEGAPSPFRVISGTSAGAINAGGLAAGAHNFRQCIDDLENVWGNLKISDVYQTDKVSSIRAAAATILQLVRVRDTADQPRSILDNAPLQALLEKNIDFDRFQKNIDEGWLDAVAFNTSSYTSGKSISYFMGNQNIQEWDVVRRKGVRDTLTVEHLMGSSAIPMVFPAVRIRNDYQGDGALRQTSPLSPLLSMGANRLLIIGVSNSANESDTPNTIERPYPSPGQISGYLFESLFLESLDADLERLEHYNTLLRNVPGRHIQLDGSVIQPVDKVVITPSVDVRDIVSRHMHRFPKSMKVVLRVLGAHKPEGRQISSYLLFESSFCQELMELGYSDGKDNMRAIDRLLTPPLPAASVEATG